MSASRCRVSAAAPEVMASRATVAQSIGTSLFGCPQRGRRIQDDDLQGRSGDAPEDLADHGGAGGWPIDFQGTEVGTSVQCQNRRATR